ncbi:hypothetical protein GCM10009661_40890 [Catellatospora chokoriensis]|uniref:Helix-hairpin-helix DNA-binding motif class 1 domain-containing protein n=2 Tax=Catellatospora chokoriensis TaxID=310353 RepID=A0A8J3JM85_9ACTN|nr:ComEA family DNA-binding protein [Catellatospora chokoriensis]GIF87591.1 hypothetical protein Cch02nite_10350 [Catellatospora chokoriensis]
MPPTPFRKPQPAEADLDRLHRVLAPATAPPSWPEPLDAPFLDVLPDYPRPRPTRQLLPLDPATSGDAQAHVWPWTPPAVPQADGLSAAARHVVLPVATSHGVLPASGSVSATAMTAAPSGAVPAAFMSARPSDDVRADPDVPSAEVPSSALPGRSAFDPGRRGLRALAAVAVLVVALAAYLAWQARPSVEPAPEPVPVPVADSGRPVAPSSPAMLVVAVTGRVRKSGLVRLPQGARVADAIEAAGGVLPDTDLSAVNLARKVTDGELIAIGVPGVAAADGPAAGAGPGSGPVNLNAATLAQLDALPGVGPVLAQRILDHRSRHGDFRSVGDLRQVEGIGESKFAQLKDLVTV